MQISLRSQMIAGTTALVGATAIAMTPVAPAVSIPSLSTAKSAVALAAFANPLAEVVGTANMALNYVLNGNYSTVGGDAGETNWGPYSGPIGPVTNYGLTLGLLPDGSYGPSINAVGIIPDFLGQPFPILTQVINNQLGYLNNALQAVNAVVGAAVNVVWTPVQLALVVTSLALSGNIALIPAAITEAITQVVTGFQVAIGVVVDSVQTIFGNLIAKASAVASTIALEAPLLIQAATGQALVVSNKVQDVITKVTTALSTGDFMTAWNEAITGLLGPSGIPGTLVNLSLGAGIQTASDLPPLPGSLVPSTRVLVETTGQAITTALKQTAPTPTPRSTAAKAVAAAAATTGDNSVAAKTASTPAASVLADGTAPAAPKASKAGALRAGRS